MRKKCLSVFMTACVFSAFPSVLSCQCVEADCSSVSKVIQTNVLRCHPASASAKAAGSSRKNCCGKCQIEKAAVLLNEFSPAKDIRQENDGTDFKAIFDRHGKFQREILPQGKFSGSSPGFFIQRVLNTTFSYRAPPQS